MEYDFAAKVPLRHQMRLYLHDESDRLGLEMFIIRTDRLSHSVRREALNTKRYILYKNI